MPIAFYILGVSVKWFIRGIRFKMNSCVKRIFRIILVHQMSFNNHTIWKEGMVMKAAIFQSLEGLGFSFSA